jgi:hypothetical protein
VYVLVSNQSASVCEADDCTSLSVRIAAAEDADALTEAGLGQWSGEEEMDLDVAQLHVLAAAAATLPDWEQRWTAMIDYAARSGWLAPDRSTVRAHLVNGGSG